MYHAWMHCGRTILVCVTVISTFITLISKIEKAMSRGNHFLEYLWINYHWQGTTVKATDKVDPVKICQRENFGIRSSHNTRRWLKNGLYQQIAPAILLKASRNAPLTAFYLQPGKKLEAWTTTLKLILHKTIESKSRVIYASLKTIVCFIFSKCFSFQKKLEGTGNRGI